MNNDEIAAYLPSVLAGFEYQAEQDEYVTIRIGQDALIEACKRLRDDKTLRMQSLHLLTVVDYEEYFEVVYHLYSYVANHMIVIKVKVNHEKPVVPSVYEVWKGADYMEREGYDLFGVRFEGHPNLRRLLLTDDWIGHPMRKDYKLERPVKEES